MQQQRTSPSNTYCPRRPARRPAPATHSPSGGPEYSSCSARSAFVGRSRVGVSHPVQVRANVTWGKPFITLGLPELQGQGVRYLRSEINVDPAHGSARRIKEGSKRDHSVEPVRPPFVASATVVVRTAHLTNIRSNRQRSASVLLWLVSHMLCLSLGTHPDGVHDVFLRCWHHPSYPDSVGWMRESHPQTSGVFLHRISRDGIGKATAAARTQNKLRCPLSPLA